MRVKDVMNKAIAIDHDISVKEAARIMSDKNIGSLVVVDGNDVLGIVTEKDIVANADTLTRKIYSIMAKNVVTIHPEENLDNAALLMAKNKIKRLPVVEKQKLVGLISATDLLAHADELDEEFFFD